MNNHEVKAKLNAQRKWREGASSPFPTRSRRRLSKFPFFLHLFWIIGSLYAAWTLTPYLPSKEVTPNSAPEISNTNTPTAGTEQVTQESTTMIVCAGGFDTAKLHVRFEAGLDGAIRGYLKEGESVVVLLGEQGEPITKTIDDVSWTFIQLPINGWVSANHLCK